MKSLVPIFVLLWVLTASAQTPNTHVSLVQKLDAMRVPPEDFTARVTVQKTKAGASTSETATFRQYSHRRVEANGRVVLDTLVVCDEPARDAGKMILFVGDACWFFDPRAKRASRMPAQQVASQALVADLMNWRFTDDFDHTLAGRESVTAAGSAHPCTVLDFTPKPGVKNRSPLVRCWIDDAGHPWKAEHYTASRRVFRQVLFTRYETVLGARRATGLRIDNHGDIEDITLSEMKAGRSPADWFDPEKLPTIKTK
ncbi:MAG: outer membrane lipoprotein-sorting protein [Verrucomicrobiaceae bacterium]|nr:outer membrane lipoprotein-sorting protein [Verrucomicrobiaceae bacterium]